VLLRFASLGFIGANMVLDGIPLRVVGEDATFMRGRDGTDTSFETNSLVIYPGNSIDAIFTAPPYRGTGPYDTYLLYNRSYGTSNSLAGGQMTEVRVYPAGTLAPQSLPNT
jgi:hypothetical protein